jgi:sialic acid synthase SpsE
MLKKISLTKKPIILSTGASTIKEIQAALKILKKNGSKNISILHCILNYPTINKHANLKMITSLRKLFPNNLIGYSDHTLGIDVGAASVALGACVIEKHVTLDKTIIGMDNQMAIEYDEIKQMILSVKNVFNALGKFEREVSSDELNQRAKMRRSLIVNTDLNPGDVLTKENLGAKRPGTGISVSEWDLYLGKVVNKKIEKDSLIFPKDLE